MSQNSGSEAQTGSSNPKTDVHLSFSWKPAALRHPVGWHLAGTLLTGPNGVLDLTRVTSAAWVDYVAKGFRITRLDLFENGNKRVSISITSALPARANDIDMLAFGDCVAAIAGVLASRDQMLPVTIGENGRAGLAMFAVGVASVLGAIGLFAASLSGLGGANGLGSTLVPILAISVFGIAIAWPQRPWRQRPEVPISRFIATR